MTKRKKKRKIINKKGIHILGHAQSQSLQLLKVNNYQNQMKVKKIAKKEKCQKK